MLVVRVNHVGTELPQYAREAPRGREIDLLVRRQRNDVESFRHSATQLTIGMRDENSALTDFPQAEHRVHHLVLPTAPGTAGVYVQREQWEIHPLVIGR